VESAAVIWGLIGVVVGSGLAMLERYFSRVRKSRENEPEDEPEDQKPRSIVRTIR